MNDNPKRLHKFKIDASPLLLALTVLMVCGVAAGTAVWAGDPSGSKTGVATDIVGATSNSPGTEDFKTSAKDEPFANKVSDAVGQNRVAINMVWVLMAGFFVMFMQAGFALVETGFCRAKNAAHTMMMNFAVYPLGMFGFWVAGFALMMGGVGVVANLGGTAPLNTGAEFSLNLFGKEHGLFAHNGFFLSGDSYDVGVMGLFLFQMVFMDTAVTIPTGAMAERWKWGAFVVYSFFMSVILYPLFGNWAWGGGWLATLGKNFGLGHGYVDFAGSGVVHAVGGLCGLAGAMVLEPRIGKYNKDGSANAIPGHHIPMAILGCLILAFGWFGFNPGSTLGASGAGNLRIAIIATVTMLAGTGGAIGAMLYLTLRGGRPDPTMVVNGLLAGLVAITAPSGFVGAPAAMVIGFIAGILVCAAVPFFDKVHVDDPVGAISVHGVCGLWGVLAVGIFADGTFGGGWNGVDGTVKGLLYGDPRQFVAQLIGCATLAVWAFGFSWVFFTVQKKVMGIRVSEEVELGGLDLPEVGVLAYPDFEVHGVDILPSHFGPARLRESRAVPTGAPIRSTAAANS
ncbi:MAG: ammonium transporter [Armatimonadetes bacterium]|nr:ammonium transporter [Armatimonadota bacterium]